MLEKENLKNLRLQIDDVDRQIIELFKTRFKHSVDIGRSKKKLGIKVVDIERETEIFENLLKYSQESNLDSKFIRKIWEVIFKQSQESQNKSHDK